LPNVLQIYSVGSVSGNNIPGSHKVLGGVELYFRLQSIKLLIALYQREKINQGKTQDENC
jgi:hypothetical protein